MQATIHNQITYKAGNLFKLSISVSSSILWIVRIFHIRWKNWDNLRRLYIVRISWRIIMVLLGSVGYWVLWKIHPLISSYKPTLLPKLLNLLPNMSFLNCNYRLPGVWLISHQVLLCSVGCLSTMEESKSWLTCSVLSISGLCNKLYGLWEILHVILLNIEIELSGIME